MIVTLVMLLATLVIGTLVGAIILRGAIGLYNMLAGGSGAAAKAPELPMSRAMAVMFVTTLVHAGIQFLFGLVMSGGRGEGMNITPLLVSLPISVAVIGGMLSLLLPTTFGRGLMIALCHLLIVAVIGGGIMLLSAMVLR